VDQFPRPPAVLVDFLEHKVRIPAFDGGVHALGDDLGLAGDGAAVIHPVKLHRAGAEGDDLAVVEMHDAPRERQDRGQVGRNAREILPNARHQPRSFLKA
jgi:hypothetical protein